MEALSEDNTIISLDCGESFVCSLIIINTVQLSSIIRKEILFYTGGISTLFSVVPASIGTKHLFRPGLINRTLRDTMPSRRNKRTLILILQ